MRDLPIRTRITIAAGVMALAVLFLVGMSFLLYSSSEDTESLDQADPPETEEFVGEDEDGLGIGAEVVVPVVLLLAVGTGLLIWVSLGRTLRPVRAMTAQVDQINDRNLHQRLTVPSANDELRTLATTMNRMLDRLQHSQALQRQFVSDASHELRSPITATQATLEVARNDPDHTDWLAVSGVLTEENERLAALVDDLLLLARLDEHPQFATPSLVDLDELCIAEAERARPTPVRVHVATPARVIGSPAMLTRAIRNLVDNAAHHAETEVVVEVGTDPAGTLAMVTVHDDGAGIPPPQRAWVFERFTRLDEARSRERGAGGGAGLGLAIVKGVAEAHGGNVAIVGSDHGGAAFTIALPTAPR